MGFRSSSGLRSHWHISHHQNFSNCHHHTGQVPVKLPCPLRRFAAYFLRHPDSQQIVTMATKKTISRQHHHIYHQPTENNSSVLCKNAGYVVNLLRKRVFSGTPGGSPESVSPKALCPWCSITPMMHKPLSSLDRGQWWSQSSVY